MDSRDTRLCKEAKEQELLGFFVIGHPGAPTGFERRDKVRGAISMANEEQLSPQAS